MNPALLIAISAAAVLTLVLALSGKQRKAAQEKARARRLAEHRMNARLLRFDI